MSVTVIRARRAFEEERDRAVVLLRAVLGLGLKNEWTIGELARVIGIDSQLVSSIMAQFLQGGSIESRKQDEPYADGSGTIVNTDLASYEYSYRLRPDSGPEAVRDEFDRLLPRV